ncbi:galactose-3-O-sulfotransferase 4 isoform X3 [Hippoglossus hippoglossus]|uniref:galactose-3-O-sulfotransferase 4 isoform X3 n=1 Tax=Hippoglossus hippoglossus TaxID=8267 RepID=UPI00148CA059|nr:galactose-3-O-sulfotransferase 4 isoform X3 [Hippoglossus hippoglossus]XP_035005137.1 galactose-3-O-sulfotransferase 4 isoform X4 [Hippoglossus stenolepis]
MLFRRRARMLRWLVCGRLGPVWMWKALLLFVAIAFASQLLGVIFNKSVHPAAHSIFSSPDAQGPSLGSCQPHTHIMFLKTHKTASSTVLNMLYRFGEERNLRFALPMGYQLGYPLPFNAHRVKGYRGPGAMEFHIMGNHMRFHKLEVEKVMPEDTFYFSIIRDPVSLAESSFAYYKEVAPAFRKAKGLGDFADDPKKYYDPRLRNNHYARNLLWFDFGMDHNANFSMALAQRGEAMIRRAFKLILVSEYFDHSMILLRHALCWPLDAVVSFSLNARQQKPSGIGVMSGSWVGKAVAGVGVRGGHSQAKMPPNLPLTEEQRERLRQWNALDWYLYKAVNQTFWEEIQRFGLTEMEQEVALLRTRREELARVCLRDGGKPVEAYRIRDKTIRPFQSGLVKILGYELHPGLDNTTRTACLRMIRPEIQYKDVLDAKQFPRDSAAQVQPGQQGQGRMVSAGGSFLRQDSSRTGETLVVGEVGGRTVEEGERDWDASHSIRTNQTLMRGKEKGRLR